MKLVKWWPKQNTILSVYTVVVFLERSTCVIKVFVFLYKLKSSPELRSLDTDPMYIMYMNGRPVGYLKFM